jgi:FlgD Ig-like domain/Cohesin domain
MRHVTRSVFLLALLLTPFAAPRAAQANLIGAQTPATCVSLAHPCVTVPVTLQRDDAIGVLGYSVTFTLSPELTLCGSITSAGFLANPYYHVTDHGDGSYTVDEATLGVPCGATGGGTLFNIPVQSASSTASGTVTVTSVILRDCDNNDVAVTAGPATSVSIDQQTPSAVTLSAAQKKTGNSATPAGTTDILVSWTGQEPASSVAVYRKGFGGYPFYDDDGGVAPTAPASAAAAVSAGWQLTTVASSGGADRAATRDVWYYVAFVTDACGNTSAVSNLTGGTVNYALGDVSDGTTDCSGDNLVNTSDISLLGSHYGATILPASPFACLDVGPTSDHSINGRPLTDHAIQFEDLVMFAINYGRVSAPERVAAAPLLAASADRIGIGVVPRGLPGETIEVPLAFDGTGVIQALSVGLGWDHAVLDFTGVAAGDLLALESAPGLALSSQPGDVDVALLGSGATLSGSGTLAVARFRVKTTDDPALTVTRTSARDATGREVPISGTTSAPLASPTPTALGRVYPNPVTDGMSVQLSLARSGRVSLGVYDLAGRRVRMLLDGDPGAGLHVIGWDGRGDDGRAVANGFYVVRLRTDGVSQSRTVRVLR